MEKERQKDIANLAMLTQLDRKGVLGHRYEAYQAHLEMEQLQEQQETRAQRMAEVAQQKKRREEQEEKRIMRVCDLYLCCLSLIFYNRLTPIIIFYLSLHLTEGD
jgi:hypothetical protein